MMGGTHLVGDRFDNSIEVTDGGSSRLDGYGGNDTLTYRGGSENTHTTMAMVSGHREAGRLSQAVVHVHFKTQHRAPDLDLRLAAKTVSSDARLRHRLYINAIQLGCRSFVSRKFLRTALALPHVALL